MRVAIIDYGSGNLRSATKAFERAAREAGIRDQVKIMVGGAPVTDAFCQQIGADAYTPDAASAAEKAVEFLTGEPA